MFTGLIDHTGVITQIKKLGTGIRLTIDSKFSDITEGESIAVDGVCLTAININRGQFNAELSQETLNLTIATNYYIGQKINLERSLRLCDRLGGHFVTGHVDQTACVKNITRCDKFTHVIIARISSESLKLLIPKGSLCLNGVSLTINKIIENNCHLMLIPHTLSRTNLVNLKVNELVNIEFDLLAKIIAQQLKEKNHAHAI